MPTNAEMLALILGNSQSPVDTPTEWVGAGAEISLSVVLDRNTIFTFESHTRRVFSKVSWEQKEAVANSGSWGQECLEPDTWDFRRL